MRLVALDQVHLSSVKGDNIRPREEFEVSDQLGGHLLQAHPALFRVATSAAGDDRPPKSRADRPPKTKVDPPPANKGSPSPPTTPSVPHPPSAPPSGA